MNSINIFYEDISPEYKNASAIDINEIALAVLNYMKLSDKEINLIICSDKNIHSINKEYRKKDRATDVISFANREEEFPNNVIEGKEQLGDIFLSLETAYSQSIEYEVTFKQEITRLIIHSILHLLGYDHETNPSDEKRMRNKEDEIMEFIENDS